MNALLRRAIVVLVVVPLAVCVFGLRFTCDSSPWRTLLREVHKQQQGQKLHQATLERVQDRQEVVRLLLAQRCSLKEALVHFQETNHEWPDYVTEAAKRDDWLSSELERSYQYIVALTEDLLANRPEEAAIVLRRLEKEYQHLRAGMAKKRSQPSR